MYFVMKRNITALTYVQQSVTLVKVFKDKIYLYQWFISTTIQESDEAANQSTAETLEDIEKIISGKKGIGRLLYGVTTTTICNPL